MGIIRSDGCAMGQGFPTERLESGFGGNVMAYCERREAVTSHSSLCLIEGKPPMGQMMA